MAGFVPAPDGAILILLGILTRAPLPIDEANETWLAENGMTAPDPDSGIIDLTDRGRAWSRMILETPLPVRGEWGDPRKFPAIAGAAPASSSTPAPFVAQNPAPAPAAAFQLPPGFNANRWADLAPGTLPPGLQRDSELECVWRSGKLVKNFAGTINWKQPGADTDVMGYRVIPSA